MADIYMHGTCNLAVLGGQEGDCGGLAARAIEKIREHSLGEFGGLDAFDDMWIFESIEKLEPLSIDITQESVDALDPYREQGICEQIVDVFTLTNLREMAYLCRCPPEKPIRMDSLLEIASSFDVTDSRDVVYGMLGLFQRARDAEDIPALLSPDYTKDASVGLLLDAVHARTPHTESSPSDRKFRDFLDNAVALLTQSSLTSPPPLQDLETTLIAGVRANAHGHEPVEAALAWFRDDKGAVLPAAYVDDAHGYCQSRCFFMTDSGRMGIGPDYMAEADTIAVLSGFGWPFALRRCEGKAGQYVLLGPCYVHGVMQGQAADEHDAQGLPWKWFDLV
ncbi:hypothetical protein B0A48_03285 [Cryoendolithus antarcticus]|uniref:Heterokaryon incompatibility domain-containing protein n=1 Tax=Cryoendolithus antarcticus TaxID=1507870 RepID=A0A1V8TJY9_9PEZI|nr:hypothetical protein B0A48_03285 [Cryoendolithus antarcticus]